MIGCPAHTYACVLASVAKQIPLEPATAPQVPRSSHARWHQAASSCTHTRTHGRTLILTALSSSLLSVPSPSSHFVFSADLQPDLIPGGNNYQSGHTVSIEPFWGWQLNHVLARVSRLWLWHSPALLKMFPRLLYCRRLRCKGFSGWKVNETCCKISAHQAKAVITQCRVRNIVMENDSLFISAMSSLCSVPNTACCHRKVLLYILLFSFSKKKKFP